LKRLGLEARIRARFEPSQMLPCAGQGALGLERRSAPGPLAAQLAQLTHRPTWLAVEAERAVSRALGGSCSIPLAAHASWTGTTLGLEALLGNARTPNAPLLRAGLAGPVADVAAARALGERIAQTLRESGADAYLADGPA
jgi:hydroxymethylbilane synthase